MSNDESIVGERYIAAAAAGGEASDFVPLQAAPRVNRQLYENSPLSTSESAADYSSDADALFNDRPPNLAVLHEKPEHRLIILLKARGLSNKAIAERIGATAPWVGQLLRQPWARARLLAEIHEKGEEGIQDLFKAAAEDSVLTLVDIRDDPNAPSQARVNAANALLDRFLGKPTQRTEVLTGKLPTSEDIAALEREVADLEAAEREASKQ